MLTPNEQLELSRTEVARIGTDLTSLRNHAQALVVFSIAVLGAGASFWQQVKSGDTVAQLAMFGILVTSILCYSRAHFIYGMTTKRYAYLDALNEYCNRLAGGNIFLDPEIKRIEGHRIPNHANMLAVPLLQWLAAANIPWDFKIFINASVPSKTITLMLVLISVGLTGHIVWSILTSRSRFSRYRNEKRQQIAADPNL